MGSSRAAAAAAVLMVCLVVALVASPIGQAHAAELLSGQVSMDQLDASPVQASVAQQADAAAGQTDAAVRLPALRCQGFSQAATSMLFLMALRSEISCRTSPLTLCCAEIDFWPPRLAPVP